MAELNVIPRQYYCSFGEFLFKNESTTTPMVVRLPSVFNNTNGFRAFGAAGVMKFRGDYIQIATSDGTRGQSFNLTLQDLNGIYIDRPACIEAEYDPVGAPGQYVPLINIGGANLATPFNNKGNVATTNWMTFAEVGRTKDTGNVFEYDEYNGGLGYGRIYLGQDNCFTFGCINGGATNVVIGATYTHDGSTYTVVAVTNGTETAGTRTRILNCRRTTGTNDPTASGTLTLATGTGDATLTFNHAVECGGWVPPNTAKIRIANIHISTDLANPLSASASNFSADGAFSEGQYDIDVVSISDRIKFDGANWNFFGKCTFKNFSVFSMPIYVSGWNAGEIIYDGLFVAGNPYAANNGWTFGRGDQPFTAKRVYLAIKSNSSSGILIFQPQYAVKEIGEIHLLTPRIIAGGTFAYQNLSASYLKSMYPDRQAVCGPWYLAGYKAYLGSVNSIHITEIHHSDSVTGIATTMFPCCVAEIATDSSYLTIGKVRLLPGGAPCYQQMFPVAATGEMFSITDIDYDGRHPQTLANHTSSINTTGLGRRGHITNAVIKGNRQALMGGATAMPGPARLANVFSTTGGVSLATAENGLTLECASATGGPGSNGLRRVGSTPQQLYITGTSRTVGLLQFNPNRTSTPENEFMEVLSGGASWGRTSGGFNYYCREAGSVRFKCPRPILGIAAGGATFSGTTVTTSAVYTAGLTVDFRMCNWGDDITAVSWTAISAANLQTAFNALTGYSSSVGLNIELRYTFASASEDGRKIIYNTDISNLTLDAAFVALDIGYIKMNVYGVINGSVAAFIDDADKVFGYATVGASGSYTFDSFPYDCDGLAKYYRAVVRKVGYSEVLIEGGVYALGVILPSTGVAAHPCTNADVADIAADGVAKTLTLTASKTGQQLYQKAQYWSCLEANMKYDVPVTSNDGNTLNIPSTWELIGAANISDAVTIAGCTVSGITAGTLAAGFDGCTMELGAAGAYTFTAANSRIDMTPAAPGTYNLGGCTFSGTIDLRNTAAHAITVQVPAGTTSTTANNTGGAITVVAAVNTLTVAANVSLAGAEVRIYDLDASGIDLGTELGGSESCPGSTFDLAVSGGNAVWIQVQKSGYEEFGQSYTMPANSVTFDAALRLDSNA
jgi:hypothetical protein